jgi:hypothetical protein
MAATVDLDINGIKYQIDRDTQSTYSLPCATSWT